MKKALWIILIIFCISLAGYVGLNVYVDKQQHKTVVDIINQYNTNNYIKVLETTVNGNNIYSRIQNISKYHLEDLMIVAELLDKNERPISDEDFSFRYLPPNYIADDTITVTDPYPEWSGKVKISVIFGSSHDYSKR